MNQRALIGLRACRIVKSSPIWMRPPQAMARNHTTVIGPKNFITAAVPLDWTMNRQIMMAAESGRT
ncbi:hypothetical protein D3C87_1625770 [compost metagenome]